MYYTEKSYFSVVLPSLECRFRFLFKISLATRRISFPIYLVHILSPVLRDHHFLIIFGANKLNQQNPLHFLLFLFFLNALWARTTVQGYGIDLTLFIVILVIY